MAFISKVVFMLLLLSTLAWVEVSSEESPGATASLFINGLMNVNTISKDIQEDVKELKPVSGLITGSDISKKIKKHNDAIRQNVANILSVVSSNPTLTEDDGEFCAQALGNNVAVEEDFLKTLTSKVKYIGLQPYVKDIENSLADFKDAVVHAMVIRYIFPGKSKTAVANEIKTLMNTAINPAIGSFSKQADP